MVEWVQITSGRGPEECRLAVGKVYEKFLHAADVFDAKVTVVHSEPSKNHKGNYLSMILKVEMEPENNFVEDWIGTVQWTQKSPYRKCGRKNWFVGIQRIVLPKPEDISLDDIEIKAIRSSGKGGQNVNKVSSAVQIIHKPTGLVIKSQEERSQKMNKKIALQRLIEVLTNKIRSENNQIDFSNWMQHNTLTRGDPVQWFSA